MHRKPLRPVAFRLPSLGLPPWSSKTRCCPATAGRGGWRFSQGRAELTATETTSASLRLGPNGFAALYAGTPVHVLRTAGLASAGDPAGDDLLDAVFAGRAAYLLEYF